MKPLRQAATEAGTQQVSISTMAKMGDGVAVRIQFLFNFLSFSLDSPVTEGDCVR